MRNLGTHPDSDYNHLISRVVDRQFVLKEQEKEYFRQLLFKQAAFVGVTVVAWCFMSNILSLCFSDGAVLGSKSFVDSFFEGNRSSFGPNRDSGARKLRISMGGLTSVRDLSL